MQTRVVGAAVAACALILSLDAEASTVVGGFNTNSIAACDDCFVQSALPFSVNFFGQTYSNIYVSNNGYVTFGAGQDDYTPFGLGAGYIGKPIIAAFFADVDTRGAGSAITTYGDGTYNGHQAFGITWPGVGYFDAEDNKLNTFQEILTDRSDLGVGDFDIYFNYAQINWETGEASGGSNGLGGTSAAVGFSNGTGDPGTFFQLPGSLVPGSFLDGGPAALVTGTNDNVPGQLLFAVRNGAPMILPTVPEPATWALFLIGFGVIGGALRAARKAPSAA